MRIAVAFAFTWFIAFAGPPDRAGLGRSFHQLKKTNALTIGYFGGPITAGATTPSPQVNTKSSCACSPGRTPNPSAAGFDSEPCS
jgi:hypothetical protein